MDKSDRADEQDGPEAQDVQTGCDLIALDDAYKRGDLEAIKTALGNPTDFPNGRGPQAVGGIILEYAISHSPVPFIRTLLELGADREAKTTVDDYNTPLEEAELIGSKDAAAALRNFPPG